MSSRRTFSLMTPSNWMTTTSGFRTSLSRPWCLSSTKLRGLYLSHVLTINWTKCIVMREAGLLWETLWNLTFWFLLAVLSWRALSSCLLQPRWSRRMVADWCGCYLDETISLFTSRTNKRLGIERDGLRLAEWLLSPFEVEADTLWHSFESWEHRASWSSPQVMYMFYLLGYKLFGQETYLIQEFLKNPNSEDNPTLRYMFLVFFLSFCPCVLWDFVLNTKSFWISFSWE